MKILITLLLLSIVTPALPKATLACYEEPGTRKTLCIDESAVTANGDIRASPLYSGGPNEVRKTGYIFVTNCAKKISTLQDRDGVNFAGGFSSTTSASRSLSEWACDVTRPRKDSKIKQF